jgi:hypothetical protein
MKERSNKLSEQRERRDNALLRKASAKTPQEEQAADEDVKQAKNDMLQTGGEAISELSTKVTTELVTAPIKPATAGGLILLDQTSDALGEGIKVIAATGECADEPFTECRISVQKTDASGRVMVASGTHTVLISEAGMARIVVDGVTVEPQKSATLRRELIPIDQATSANVTENDKGTSGVASGTFPPDSNYYVQIHYSVGGAALDEPKDTYNFTNTRSYTGTLSGGVLQVSGHVWMSAYASHVVTATVSAGDEKNEERFTLPGGDEQRQSYRVSLAIPDAAQRATFRIAHSGSSPYGARGIVVTGTLTR